MTTAAGSSNSSLRPLRLRGEGALPAPLTIRWNRQRLDLFADRAVHWPRAKTIIIADPHFGKAAAFRANGVPVPAGTTQCALDRLTRLIESTAARRLIVLGDLLHAAAGRSQSVLNAVAQWRAKHEQLDVLLVRGNHDRHAGDPPPEWRIACADEPYGDGPFAFLHYPEAAERRGALARACFAGHLHPGAVLRDDDGSTLRVACFHFSPRLAVLPAFGEFTGMHPIKPGPGDRLFAAGEQVLEITIRKR